MAPGLAESPRLGRPKVDGELPVAETHEVGDLACSAAAVGVVAGATSSSLRGPVNVQIVEVLRAVAKIRGFVGGWIGERFGFVALKAEAVGVLAEAAVEAGRIISGQQADLGRTVRFVAGRAAALLQRSMMVRMRSKVRRDIGHRTGGGGEFPCVAAQAQGLRFGEEEVLGRGGVRIVARCAGRARSSHVVRHGLGETLTDLLVAIRAETGTFRRKKKLVRAAVSVVTRRTALRNGGVGLARLRHPLGEGLVAAGTQTGALHAK